MAELARRAAERLGYQDHVISVGPASIRIRVVGDTLADRLLPAFARANPVGEPQPGPLASSTVVAWDMAEAALVLPALSLLPRPGDAPRSTYLHDHDHGQGDGQAQGGIQAWFQPLEAAVSLYDHTEATGYYCVRHAAALPAWESAAPLRALLRWALADHDLHLVHSAAVGDARGALLLAARGGSGKSTSTALCAAAGLQTAGDDYVVLSPGGPDGSGPQVHSLYRTLKVGAELLDRRFAGLETRDAGHDKRSVWLDDVALGAQVPTMGVAAIVVPSVAEAARESSFRTVSAAVAIRGLGPSTLLQLPGRAERALAAMSAVAEQVPAYEGELGRDLDRVAPDLVELLDRATSQKHDCEL